MPATRDPWRGMSSRAGRAPPGLEDAGCRIAPLRTYPTHDIIRLTHSQGRWYIVLESAILFSRVYPRTVGSLRRRDRPADPGGSNAD